MHKSLFPFSDFVCRSSDIALFDDGENYTPRVDVLAVFTTSLLRALKKVGSLPLLSPGFEQELTEHVYKFLSMLHLFCFAH